jgi:predicted RNase H-like nuclease
MEKRVLTGFDSAWTRGNRGSVVSLITEDGQHQLIGPHSASFDEAVEHVRSVTEGADLHALAIDQPLIVNNDAGRRPVEDVVSHVMGRFGSAVQPANRSKDTMFGSSAPIWSCLEAFRKMGFTHNHHAGDRMSASGRFYFEVYPALGNLGLFPAFYARGVVPRYNPQRRRTFDLDDWRLLTDAVMEFLEQHGVVCSWLMAARASVAAPRKQTQDQLDSVICLCHAISWTGGEPALVVGDMSSGYMVVPSHDDLTAHLVTHATSHGVAVWTPAENGLTLCQQ